MHSGSCPFSENSRLLNRLWPGGNLALPQEETLWNTCNWVSSQQKSRAGHLREFEGNLERSRKLSCLLVDFASRFEEGPGAEPHQRCLLKAFYFQTSFVGNLRRLSDRECQCELDGSIPSSGGLNGHGFSLESAVSSLQALKRQEFRLDLNRQRSEALVLRHRDSA